MRKIGSITPIWNQELWIKPHFEMLSKLDKNVVLLHKRPLPTYHIEHGYGTAPDLSEQILREQFPNVEIYYSQYPEGKEFGPDIYNEGLKYLQDCDIVFRLDPDMFFTDTCWDKMITFIKNTEYDSYHMEFAIDSVNYYMTGDFEHGLKDAEEYDPLAFNPKLQLQSRKGGILVPTAIRSKAFFCFKEFFCHHFRGWNKPRSTPNPGWAWQPEIIELVEGYGDNGEFYICPDEIRQKIEPWLKELEVMKHDK